MVKTNEEMEVTGHTDVEDFDKALADVEAADTEMGLVKNKDSESSNIVQEAILKIPALSVIYWCEKMAATTFGETFADMWSQTLDFGYAATSITLFTLFFITVAFQLKVKTYWPVLFWTVMATSSIAGTCFSDLIDRTLHLGYAVGMSVLLALLLVIAGGWKLSGEPMNVAGAMSRKAECFYWATILVSNTLGTALGDFFADSLELGFAASAGIFGSLLVVMAILAYFTKVSHVVLFWCAFVVTRPFGATFGDLLTKSTAKGGLDLGTGPASAVIFGIFCFFFAIEMYMIRKTKAAAAKVPKEIIDDTPPAGEE